MGRSDSTIAVRPTEMLEVNVISETPAGSVRMVMRMVRRLVMQLQNMLLHLM